MAQKTQSTSRRSGRRVVKKNVAQGHAYIKLNFINTIVSITDPSGAVISGPLPDRLVSRDPASPPILAAQMAAESAARKAMEHGMKKVDVFVKGPGSGRETAIRLLAKSPAWKFRPSLT